MSPQLFITKRRHWADRSGRVIEHADWRAAIDGCAQASLRVIPTDSSKKRASQLQGKRYRDCFVLERGCVKLTSPDALSTRLAVDLARELNATVQGILGEVYYRDAAGKIRHIWPTLGLPDPAEHHAVLLKRQERQEWVSRWTSFALYLLVVLGVAFGASSLSPPPSRPTPTLPLPRNDTLIRSGVQAVKVEIRRRELLKEQVRAGQFGEAALRLLYGSQPKLLEELLAELPGREGDDTTEFD